MSFAVGPLALVGVPVRVVVLAVSVKQVLTKLALVFFIWAETQNSESVFFSSTPVAFVNLSSLEEVPAKTMDHIVYKYSVVFFSALVVIHSVPFFQVAVQLPFVHVFIRILNLILRRIFILKYQFARNLVNAVFILLCCRLLLNFLYLLVFRSIFILICHLQIVLYLVKSRIFQYLILGKLL